MGSGVPCTELGGGPLVAVVSWNQVGRIDLTPVTLPESVLLTLSRRRLWYIGGIIHAGTNTTTYWTFHATWRSLGLKSGVMHRTCPSMTRTYDSVRSKDAVTLRPKYNSLNQYSLSNMNERCGGLVSRTCLAGCQECHKPFCKEFYDPILELGKGVLDRLKTLIPYSASAKQRVCLLCVWRIRQQRTRDMTSLITSPILANRHLPVHLRLQFFHSLIATKLFFFIWCMGHYFS